jgi:hypothetical protein
MKLTIESINCEQYDSRTKRTKLFRVAKYSFNYLSDSEDRKIIDSIIHKAKKLANDVNPGAANNSSLKRDYSKILNNCIAGVLSEFLWEKFLNSDKLLVEETEYERASNQIDLKVLSNSKKIEVRSSFPRNGIDFALCSSSHEFDVIGMYSNGYKPDEIQKDYYVRALFHLKIERYWEKDAVTRIPILEKLIDKIQKNGFEAFLTGGATWEMMIDDSVGKNKSFIPEDEITISRLKTKTEYRVVPFSKALDTIQILELINIEK